MEKQYGATSDASASCVAPQEGKKFEIHVSHLEESVKRRLEMFVQLPKQLMSGYFAETYQKLDEERLSHLQSAEKIEKFQQRMLDSICAFNMSDTASMGGMDVLLGQQADAAFAASSLAAADTPCLIPAHVWALEGARFAEDHHEDGLAYRQEFMVITHLLRCAGQLTDAPHPKQWMKTLRKVLFDYDRVMAVEVCAEGVPDSQLFKHFPKQLKCAFSEWAAQVEKHPELKKWVDFGEKVMAFIADQLAKQREEEARERRKEAIMKDLPKDKQQI